MTRIRTSVLQTAAVFIVLLAMVRPAAADTRKSGSTDKVAIVNGAPVYRDELDEGVLMLQKTLLGLGKPLTCGQVVSVRKEVIESLVRRELLYQEVLKRGIKPDEKAVNKEIEALKQQFPDEAEYKKELSRRNISEDILRSRLERNNAIQQYVNQLAMNVMVPDSDIVSYYEGNLNAFRQPLQVRVSHILVRSDPSWDAARKEDARRKAERILKQLKAGKDFAELARQQSDGPDRANGGDLGYIRMGQLGDRQLETAIFNLKPGETSGIVETAYGFNLFKVFDRKPETILAYDDVKKQIKEHLVQEKAKQEAETEARKLREKADVEILVKEETCSQPAVAGAGGA